MLKLGLVVNPLAGLGGSLAHKGSDGQETRNVAIEQAAGAPDDFTRAEERTKRALQSIGSPDRLKFFTWAGSMGERILADLGLPCEVLGNTTAGLSTSGDTSAAVKAMVHSGVDLILFAGGDGTARDIYDAIGQSCPVLGIPAGVKMHSGVFAVSPEAAGEVIGKLSIGGLVDLRRVEVRDIDEAAFRQDRVRTRFYGEMTVPARGQFLQHTKVGGREDQGLVAADIAAWLVEGMEEDRLYILGPGSTTAAINEELGIASTLLGVDIVQGGKLLAADVDESRILEALSSHSRASLVVTAIGGQGHIFGRGNQQLSPEVIRRIGKEHVILVAAKSKISDLEGRPLLADTNDAALDSELEGFWPVTTGYDDQIMYRVGKPWET